MIPKENPRPKSEVNQGPYHISNRPDNGEPMSNSKFPDSSNYMPVVDSNNLTLSAVTKLSAWHPFVHLFIIYATIQYNLLDGTVSKIDAAIRKHPRFFSFCRKADAIFTSVICLLFVALAVILLWKLLYATIKF